MTRNTALRGLAWLILMFVANGTSVGKVMDNSLNAAAGQRLAGAELFWLSFAILTVLAIYMGNVFVALWGEKTEKEEKPRPPRSMVGVYVGYAVVVIAAVVLLNVVR
jgi:hypothetical protein